MQLRVQGRRQQGVGRSEGRASQAGVEPRAEMLLDLQRSAGNRAVAKAIAGGSGFPTVQRFDLGVIDIIGELADDAGKGIKDTLNRLSGAGKPTLRKGSKQKASVIELQELLIKRGAGIAADGDFRAKTDAAVREFQGDHGLVVDGVAGPMTWGQLIRGGDADPLPGRRRRAFAKASAVEKADWVLLGGTPEQWNDGKSPGLQAATNFAALTDPQKAAAVRLGYTRESWNTGREGTADKALEEYADEEAKGGKKSGGALPAKWAGSLRSRSILDAEYGNIKPIKLPTVVLLTESQTKAKWEGFNGPGSYPAGGLEGFELAGTNYLNMGSQSADTVIHEMLHAQEHTDWDALAHTGITSIGEGATEMLTKRAANRFEIPVSTSYASEHALVDDMNKHSSLDHMMHAYFLGGSRVTTYRNEVEAGLVTGKRWADFKARIDAGDIPGARAMLK